jgi:predicted transcriptional regulator
MNTQELQEAYYELPYHTRHKYVRILRLIDKGVDTLNEICAELNEKPQSLDQKLKRLKELGIIERDRKTPRGMLEYQYRWADGIEKDDLFQLMKETITSDGKLLEKLSDFNPAWSNKAAIKWFDCFIELADKI